MEAEKLRVAREKITRVFRYLEALNQHRNPPKRQIREQPWHLWLHDLPTHSAIRHSAARSSPGSTKTKGGDGQNEAAPASAIFSLRVQRPLLTRPPEPPNEIASWLEPGWDDPFHFALVAESREEPQGNGAILTIHFAADPARTGALRRWAVLRDEWARTEKPARQAMQLFETLYSLYGRIDREAERVELVLGDGILSWQRAEGGIFHPILLQRLQLQFDAAVPEFTLSEAEHPVELYSALFQSMADVDGRVIGRCREELEQGGFHPLYNGTTSNFLKRMVVQLSPRGEFLEDSAPRSEQPDPRIGRDPVIFLRPRTLGFAAAIEGILADVRTREDLPWSLLNIVGEESPIPDAEPADAETSENAAAENGVDVLLSKPANPEQIRIARQLEEHGGVLVQGPPGTGKTHTIGNLIGHLLAQGKSVLVTSHTTKALRMVRHHIVPELRPLCVSLLESDLDSRKQLESAVGSIAERLSRADAGSLEIEWKKLEAERSELLKKLDDVRNLFADARADEYRDMVIAGKSWAPADAARKVAQEKETLGWIPGPVAAVAPLPLSPPELADLYRTNVTVTRDDETELSGHLPELHDLPRPEDFEASVSERNRLGMEDLELRSDLWQASSSPGSPHDLESLASSLTQAVEPLSGKEKWKLAAVYAGKYGDAHRQPWDQLVSFVRLVHREAANAQESFVKYGPQLSAEHALEDQERIAGEILGHLENGGKLGSFTLLTHKSWNHFIESAKVNNAHPRLPEHFHALRKLSRLKTLRLDLAGRWDRQVAALGTPPSAEMGVEVEKTLMQFCYAIENCLGWHEHPWLPLEQQLEDLGFRWEKFLAEQPAVVGPDGELVRIGRAVHNSLLPILDSRYKKLKLLQLNDELDRRAGVSLEGLQTKSEKLREQLRRFTVGLIDKRAWSAQARRTSSRQRQALVGWLDTIRRIGKGHGIRVSLLRAEAARKMSECRGAVPVWVMPLSRVAENFDPRTTRFDVVLIDEASKTAVMPLFALYF